MGSALESRYGTTDFIENFYGNYGKSEIKSLFRVSEFIFFNMLSGSRWGNIFSYFVLMSALGFQQWHLVSHQHIDASIL